ncbi:MAG: GYF domain-containing protein, partial [Deltaproteobacteria bacterium]|nr:GYF domain-containing protein [Deltaproteobacteria bacterium]
MKIVCENCQAKYSIADDKVRGKVFKIRCKKCGETIVVHGDARGAVAEPGYAPPPMPAAPPAGDGEIETKVFDYSGYPGQGADDPAVWHIVVEGGEQQGPYTGGQLKEYVEAGSLDYETLVWREGLADWAPLKQVADLMQIMRGKGPAASAPAHGGGLFDGPPGAGGGGGGMFDAAPAASRGGGLFDSAPGLFDKAPTPAASPAARAQTSFGGGNDDLFGGSPKGEPEEVFSSTGPASDGGLFGDSDRSGGLFAGNREAESGRSRGGDLFSSAGDDMGGGGFGAAPAQAASPRVSPRQIMMTGQRNENSV